jgi:hypothetical protein
MACAHTCDMQDKDIHKTITLKLIFKKMWQYEHGLEWFRVGFSKQSWTSGFHIRWDLFTRYVTVKFSREKPYVGDCYLKHHVHETRFLNRAIIWACHRRSSEYKLLDVCRNLVGSYCSRATSCPQLHGTYTWLQFKVQSTACCNYSNTSD